MSELSLSIRDLRTELQMTLAELAVRLGLSSAGHMSQIERGGPCSVKVALAIEALSNGRISAAALNEDVASVRAVDHVGGTAIAHASSSSGKSSDVTAEAAA